MISTIEWDFVVKDGVVSFQMKEYPNWHGIEGIGFIWINSTADPEIEYKGKRINSHIIEDTMWERFREECESNGVVPNEDEFTLYMKANSDDVYELIDLVIDQNIV